MARSRKRHKNLKSGKSRTTDSIVKQITWPHKLVYTSGREPAVYEQLSMSLFVSPYMTAFHTVKSGVTEMLLKHLRELMTDVSTYGWEPI